MANKSGRRRATNGRIARSILLAFLIALAAAAGVRPASAYSPQKGDSFAYSETIAVNNGQGSYSGYTDQTQATGMEQMNSISGSSVSASYSDSYQFSSNQGSSTSSSSSGTYTWSSSSYIYMNGTDGQVGYSSPTYVWFAMNPALAVGATFYSLNTRLTVMSRDYSLQLPTEGGKFVQTIQAEGTGEYQRNDSYGVFTASYTWDEYFDPTTGYIVGYLYVEHDSGQYQGQAGSFTYTDALYVTSTSYALALASSTSASVATSTTTGSSGSSPYLLYLAVIVIVVLLIMVVYLAARRGRRSRLPKHPYSPQTPPPSPPPSETKVDLGSRPPEQVVIREVAKVNCAYCGTLIPTTAETCPVCGAPRK